MTDNKIIHIIGIPGSGKSTLGKIIQHRFKNIHVIDADEINDDSFIELYTKNPEFKKMINENTGDPQDMHIELNNHKLNDKLKNQNSHILILGNIDLKLDIDLKYILDTPLGLNYKQVNIKAIRDICNNKSSIKDLYKNEYPVSVIYAMSYYKYKIRSGFPYDIEDIQNHIQMISSNNNDYRLLSGQNILDELDKHIELIYNKNKLKYTLVHVTGPKSSGKTTLAKELQLIYGDIMHIIDLDELFIEFNTYPNTEHHSMSYQEYISKYINDHKDKPVILLGLDAGLCISSSINIKADHKIFIDIESDKLLEQRFYSQVTRLHERKKELFTEWKDNHEKIQKKLLRFVDIEEWIKMNVKCKDYYTKKGYQMVHYDNIINKITKIMFMNN